MIYCGCNTCPIVAVPLTIVATRALSRCHKLAMMPSPTIATWVLSRSHKLASWNANELNLIYIYIYIYIFLYVQPQTSKRTPPEQTNPQLFLMFVLNGVDTLYCHATERCIITVVERCITKLQRDPGFHILATRSRQRCLTPNPTKKYMYI